MAAIASAGVAGMWNWTVCDDGLSYAPVIRTGEDDCGRYFWFSKSDDGKVWAVDLCDSAEEDDPVVSHADFTFTRWNMRATLARLWAGHCDDPGLGSLDDLVEAADRVFDALQSVDLPKWSLESIVARAKAQILADVVSGKVPVRVQCFADLHNYVDANCYGSLCCDDAPPPSLIHDRVEAAQREIDRWIASRAFECEAIDAEAALALNQIGGAA